MEENRIPRHVAVILDGNGRWAKAKGLPRTFGHLKGCTNLESLCDDVKELGIPYLTVYAFSTENWKRSRHEVEWLMKLFRNYLRRCKKIAERNDMRVSVIGDISAFDEDMQKIIRDLEEFSRGFKTLYFQLALNYGSRDEMLRAIRGFAEDVKDGKRLPGELDEELFSDYLDTRGVPDPDLMIRTSGEQRLSNFLMWQMAYAEFYFTDVAWPDFDMAELKKAVDWFGNRERRYGGVKEKG
ncbi:MAG: di-trans,poly-cis-decaprenylcistransferase [Blautia sp.]|nr:di-trans,poly-cis-decaprenylcistransferase [Blautia sp.]